ncbi:hypothetical protein GF378_03045 [Candidatus Pacearchaeota archaeon]|nr:hypothetical protein [Candidatus Pacearchaeota archaeon]
METRIIGTTNNFENVEDMMKFARACARVCYTEKDFQNVMEEDDKNQLTDRLVNSGHHSVFEHNKINFYFNRIPKILAMVLNNERPYATSEKSARYTKMEDINHNQKRLYDKWMEKLKPAISEVYPQIDDSEARDRKITKLAQENARYMTSVFTPTKMVYSLDLRQLNFIRDEFKKFNKDLFEDSDEGSEKGLNRFNSRLTNSMYEFLSQTGKFEVPGLTNQTDRHLSIFDNKDNDYEDYEEHFGDTYSTTYKMSFAALGQAHRHRTIDYKIVDGPNKEEQRLGFFVPEIVKYLGNDAEKEWEEDLSSVSENDYPQAELIAVNERGTRDDFRSKMILRMCGHAQWEIMKNTTKTAEKYAEQDENFNYPIAPKCQQNMKCASSCDWGGKKALERIV